jgi:hypothetical protein
MTEVYEESCMKFFCVAMKKNDGLGGVMSISIALCPDVHCFSLIEPCS